MIKNISLCKDVPTHQLLSGYCRKNAVFSHDFATRESHCLQNTVLRPREMITSQYPDKQDNLLINLDDNDL